MFFIFDIFFLYYGHHVHSNLICGTPLSLSVGGDWQKCHSHKASMFLKNSYVSQCFLASKQAISLEKERNLMTNTALFWLGGKPLQVDFTQIDLNRLKRPQTEPNGPQFRLNFTR